MLKRQFILLTRTEYHVLENAFNVPTQTDKICTISRIRATDGGRSIGGLPTLNTTIIKGAINRDIRRSYNGITRGTINLKIWVVQNVEWLKRALCPQASSNENQNDLYKKECSSFIFHRIEKYCVTKNLYIIKIKKGISKFISGINSDYRFCSQNLKQNTYFFMFKVGTNVWMYERADV